MFGRTTLLLKIPATHHAVILRRLHPGSTNKRNGQLLLLRAGKARSKRRFFEAIPRSWGASVSNRSYWKFITEWEANYGGD